MPGCVVSATTASFRSIGNPRLRATPVITSTFENVSDIGVCLGLSLGPPAIAGVRSKQGALHEPTRRLCGRAKGGSGRAGKNRTPRDYSPRALATLSQAELSKARLSCIHPNTAV